MSETVSASSKALLDEFGHMASYLNFDPEIYLVGWKAVGVALNAEKLCRRPCAQLKRPHVCGLGVLRPSVDFRPYANIRALPASEFRAATTDL